MPTEIERKFLVVDDSWRDGAVGEPIRQGYLVGGSGLIVRVRVRASKATLTIKGPTEGISRDEFEYPIPLEDAWELLENHCADRIVRKTRYRVRVENRLWEVDEFHDRNEGLVLAEVELESADVQPALPDWIGQEVSDDPRYANSALATEPRDAWPTD